MSLDSSGSPIGTSAVDWEQRERGPARRVLHWLERLTLRAERPVSAAVGRSALNPLYHTGPITIFLFVIVLATGAYLTMFYRFGFDASYEAVADLEASLAGRLVRAAHRYASIAMVVTALLHGWRTFVSDRFAGPRRVAWLTGVAMVAVLWLIGVTGYWLIWDTRAQVLNDALVRVVSTFPAGLDFLLDNLVTDAAGTGWPFLLLVFAIHVVLSIAVAVLVWYHVRRLVRARWLPSGFWAAVVGGTLIFMSAVWPVGMLPALDRTLLPGAIPIDPFFLFLLPGSVSWSPGWLWGGAVVVVTAVAVVPWIIRREAPAVVAVDESRCTGCTLCAVDCPYDAVTMVDRLDHEYLHLAAVAGDRCVACGICIGSCPVDALAFVGRDIEALEADVLARASAGSVVITCDRHAAVSGATAEADLLAVPCIGMLPPDLVGRTAATGAAVHMVGCPPGDCVNREGGQFTSERMGRTRVPRLKRRYVDEPIRLDFVPPDRLDEALAAPGSTRDAFAAPLRDGWRPVLPLAGIVAAVAVLSVWVTGLVFDPDGADVAAITLALDHRAGVAILGTGGDAAAPTGGAPRLVVTLDGAAMYDDTIDPVSADDPDTALAIERFDVDPGTYRLVVRIYDNPTDGEPELLFDDTVALAAGEVLPLEYRDVPVIAAADAGRRLFGETTIGTNAGCRICHSLDPGRELVGPSLAGVASRAATRVPGLTAEEYLRESLLDPDAYVVADFPPGQMLPGLEASLSPQQIENLVAFLLTLEEEA